MRDHTTASASPCPEGRFTAVPNVLHELVTSPREYQLVALLLSYRWYSTSPIIPSTATLADRLGCSRRTVRRTVAALEARGLVARVARRADDDRQMSNLYVLCGELASAVAAIEAGRDQGGGQAQPATRSAAPGKRYSGNQTNRTRQNTGGYIRCATCGERPGGPHGQAACFTAGGVRT